MTTTPRLARALTVFHAWWEDNDMWDGDMLYADLDTAKHHSAVAYVGEEYSWMPGDDPEDEAPSTVLAWELKYGRWRLLDGGQDTGVRLGETRTYAVPAVPVAAPPTEQAVLRDRIAEALYRREWPHKQIWQQALAMDRETFEAMADAVLAVLPPPADRAAVLLWAADQIDAETRQARADEVLEPDKFRPCRDASAQLRRMAAECPQCNDTGACNGGPCPLRRLAAETPCCSDPTCTCDMVNAAGRCDCARWESSRAAETPQPETQAAPRRGDAVDQWLTAQRDKHGWQGGNDRTLFDALDNVLDQYRLHADTGTPLGEHVCEARALGQCECLEPYLTPSGNVRVDHLLSKAVAGVRQDGAQTQEAEAAVPVHAVPLPGSNGISSCCGRPPCEFVGERVTRVAGDVTCPGPDGAPSCAECDHPKDAHREGDDPITPGVCRVCETSSPDEAHHDYEAAS